MKLSKFRSYVVEIGQSVLSVYSIAHVNQKVNTFPRKNKESAFCTNSLFLKCAKRCFH